jgi:hypothetical protein
LLGLDVRFLTTKSNNTIEKGSKMLTALFWAGFFTLVLVLICYVFFHDSKKPAIIIATIIDEEDVPKTIKTYTYNRKQISTKKQKLLT